MPTLMGLISVEAPRNDPTVAGEHTVATTATTTSGVTAAVSASTVRW
jgi:hypothetical protein